jgi:hypothetical protein
LSRLFGLHIAVPERKESQIVRLFEQARQAFNAAVPAAIHGSFGASQPHRMKSSIIFSAGPLSQG